MIITSHLLIASSHQGIATRYSTADERVFLAPPQYGEDTPIGLYGSLPFLLAHGPQRAAGVLWLNAADTYVDLWKEGGGMGSHWLSEAGPTPPSLQPSFVYPSSPSHAFPHPILYIPAPLPLHATPGSATFSSISRSPHLRIISDSTSFDPTPSTAFLPPPLTPSLLHSSSLLLSPTSPHLTSPGALEAVLFGGPSPRMVLAGLTALSGLPAMPPLWAMGYHHSHWNIKSQARTRI